MRVRLTKAARTDLEDISDWIAEHNPEASRLTLEALRRRLKMIGDMPRLGRARPDIVSGLTGRVAGNYVVLSQVDPGAVTVVRIVHGKRDVVRLFQK
jgi:toxin ParE1/3/4